MIAAWLGARLVIAGLLSMAYQAIWKARMSNPRPDHSVTGDTLEPRRPAAGFGLRSNWPGLAMAFLGGILLLGTALF